MQSAKSLDMQMSTGYCTALFDNLFQQFGVSVAGCFTSKIMQFFMVVCCAAGSLPIWFDLSRVS